MSARVDGVLFGVSVFMGRTHATGVSYVALDDVTGLNGVVRLECCHRIVMIVGLSGMPSEERTRYLILIRRLIGGTFQ